MKTENIETEKIECETEKHEKQYKKFFKKTKYEMKFPDLEEEDYLTPDELGQFTCVICHAPIILEDHKERKLKGGLHAHEGCMIYYGMRALKHPKTWRQEVDEARRVSKELYGDRTRKKV